MAEFRLSPRARRDLDQIFDFTVAQWGAAQALRYTERIEAACTLLAKAPEQASPCAHIRPSYRRWRVEQHMLYFHPTAYGIAVIRILHNRMDAARHI